jgi:glucose-6-phosphate isomerase
VTIPQQAGIPEALQYLPGATLGKLLNAEKAATEYALVASERPCITIRFPQVDEHTVGQFIMLWEATTSIMGKLMNLNPYDQPAVQMGKDFTYGLMGKAGYDKQAQEFQAYAQKKGDFVV